jgi:hypothetical protein
MGHVDHLGTPKLWAIAHKNRQTQKNDKFFCHSSLEYTDCHIPCKFHGTPKQWAIAHENGPRTQN